MRIGGKTKSCFGRSKKGRGVRNVRDPDVSCMGMDRAAGVCRSVEQRKINMEEVCKALKELKREKASGVDEIRREMLKHGGEVIVQ